MEENMSIYLHSPGSLHYFAWSSTLPRCSTCLCSCVTCMCPWLILPPCKLRTPSFDWLSRISFTPLPLPHKCALGSNLSSTLCLCLAWAKRKKEIVLLKSPQSFEWSTTNSASWSECCSSTRPEDHRRHSACQIPPKKKKLIKHVIPTLDNTQCKAQLNSSTWTAIKSQL